MSALRIRYRTKYAHELKITKPRMDLHRKFYGYNKGEVHTLTEYIQQENVSIGIVSLNELDTPSAFEDAPDTISREELEGFLIDEFDDYAIERFHKYIELGLVPLIVELGEYEEVEGEWNHEYEEWDVYPEYRYALSITFVNPTSGGVQATRFYHSGRRELTMIESCRTSLLANAVTLYLQGKLKEEEGES